MNIKNLVTEKRNIKSINLDELSAFEIAKLMNDESENVKVGISKAINEIASVIDVASETYKNGGRIIYLGAGTSGRLALLDAVECPPTFGVDYNVFLGLIAGGKEAFIKAKEGAEDDESLGIKDLQLNNLTSRDFVIGIAASGRTPYVLGALRYAKESGCRTASISLTHNSQIGRISEFPIEIEVGPEILTGSTRLKAGSAQKEILNMISTGAMVLSGKVYENLMVDVKQSNNKLAQRAINIVADATNCTEEDAKTHLENANGNTKIAILMLLLEVDFHAAEILLKEKNGHIKNILNSSIK